MRTVELGPGVGLHVLITFDDRSVGIMTRSHDEFPPLNTPETRYRLALYPNDAWVQEEIAKAAPVWEGALGKKPIRHRVITTAEVPGDRFYRNAWVEDGGAIVHDMERARAVHRMKLRAVVDALLRPLSYQFMTAATPVQAERVRAQAETLNALIDDPAIDAARTVEELKATWPIGEPGDIGLMIARALQRGPMFAVQPA